MGPSKKINMDDVSRGHICVNCKSYRFCQIGIGVGPLESCERFETAPNTDFNLTNPTYSQVKS